MDGKRLSGQEGGFGCGGEMLYFEKEFCKWNKMMLFKNKNEMRGKSMMNRWDCGNWKRLTQENGTKKINQALGQAEATKPFERTRRTSVLQHSWPTWSQKGAQVLSGLFMCCLHIFVSLSLAFTCVTSHSFRSNLIFQSQQPHGQTDEMSETVKVTHPVCIPGQKSGAAISINNSLRRFGKAPRSLTGILEESF